MTLDRDRLLPVGWIELCAGALLAPAPVIAGCVGYRILCHNVTSDWGANRTNLCAGPLGEGLGFVGGVVVWLSVLVAAFGSLAGGIAARRALPDRRAAARRLIASSVVYAASVVAEFIRLGIAGVTPLAAMPFASIIPAGILLVWLVLLGVVTLAYRAGRGRTGRTHSSDGDLRRLPRCRARACPESHLRRAPAAAGVHPDGARWAAAVTATDSPAARR